MWNAKVIADVYESANKIEFSIPTTRFFREEIKGLGSVFFRLFILVKSGDKIIISEQQYNKMTAR